MLSKILIAIGTVGVTFATAFFDLKISKTDVNIQDKSSIYQERLFYISLAHDAFHRGNTQNNFILLLQHNDENKADTALIIDLKLKARSAFRDATKKLIQLHSTPVLPQRIETALDTISMEDLVYEFNKYNSKASAGNKKILEEIDQLKQQKIKSQKLKSLLFYFMLFILLSGLFLDARKKYPLE